MKFLETCFIQLQVLQITLISYISHNIFLKLVAQTANTFAIFWFEYIVGELKWDAEMHTNFKFHLAKWSLYSLMKLEYFISEMVRSTIFCWTFRSWNARSNHELFIQVAWKSINEWHLVNHIQKDTKAHKVWHLNYNEQ